MKIIVNNKRYRGWSTASVSNRLDALSDTFSFNAVKKPGIPLPFKGGEDCQVEVDGEIVLTGFIEVVDVDGDSTSHNIELTGRDRTGDILDSKLSKGIEVTTSTTLKIIIEKALINIGSSIEVIEEFTPTPFKKVDDLESGEDGETVWNFIESLARKKQVLLSSNSLGNLVITRSSGNEIDASIRHRVGDINGLNNVKSYSYSYDSTGRYNVYRISTQQNPNTIINAGDIKNEELVHQSVSILDNEIRKGRQLALVAENTGSSLRDRAIWEQNIRNARGNVYSATVQGYRNQTGAIWKTNTIVRVHSDYAGIDSRMLINAVEFVLDIEGGRSTVLSFINKNSYTLELSKDAILTDVIGAGLTVEAEPKTERDKDIQNVLGIQTVETDVVI
jgi:prophage tail gpP-like protein